MATVVVNVDAGWAPVVAALGASFLTTVGLLWRDWRSRKRERKTERLAAYESLLVQSMAVAQVANALRLTMKIRSGLKEGLHVTLRLRKLIEPLDLADRLLSTFQPLFAAQAAVWGKGSRDSIPVANQLVNRCVDLIGVATEGGRNGSGATRYVFGERWTEGQERAYMDALRLVGEQRRELALLMRDEGGEKPVDEILA